MNLESMTDEDIIESARNDLDRNVALTEIYKRHKEKIKSISWGYLKNGELVKENLGMVSEKLVKKGLTYSYGKGNGKFSTWLYETTKNSAIDIIRDQKKRYPYFKDLMKDETISTDDLIEILQNKYSDRKLDDPESVIIQKEIISRFENEIKNLKKEHFDIIKKYYFEVMRLNKAAKELNLNQSTARGTHKRILEKLRKRINGNKDFFYSLLEYLDN